MDMQTQSGFCYSYEVRKTPEKGLGVFATESVEKGQIVWRYVPGRYLVFDEQMFEKAIRALPCEKAVYELTHSFGIPDFPASIVRILDEGVLINHSDNANLATNFGVPLSAQLDVSSRSYLRNVSEALLQDRFTLIATRDIQSGEEFTNNYFEDVLDPPFYLRLCDEYDVKEKYLE
ncbi:MAG: SET domain-containing protein-lysine N-methyltransferase [Rhizobiaceae bacterium]